MTYTYQMEDTQWHRPSPCTDEYQLISSGNQLVQVTGKTKYTHVGRTRPETLALSPTPLGEVYTFKNTKTILVGESGCSIYGQWKTRLFGCTTSAKFPTISWDQSKYNSSLRKKISNCSTDISGTVAEIDEAVRTVRDLASILYDLSACFPYPTRRCLATGTKYARMLARFARRGRWQKAGDIASLQLATNFGIKPLASALYDTAESLRNRDTSVIKRITLKGKQTEESYSYPITVTENLTWKAHVYVVFQRPPASYVYFGNPAEWIWERIPFSFVVDWAIPVGEYIRSYGALTNVEDIVGTVTVRRSRAEVLKDPTVAGYEIEVPGRNVCRTYQRLLAPIPGLPAIPYWSPSTSYNALSNAIALLIQRRSLR